MALNLFKKKEEKAVKEPVKKQPEVAVEKKQDAAPAPVKKEALQSVPAVLTAPHITEKASVLGEKGQYVFKVSQDATKGAVKAAVEGLYGVSVKEVRMTRKPSKKVRTGKKRGMKPGYKKAVVQLKAGETIEVISR